MSIRIHGNPLMCPVEQAALDGKVNKAGDTMTGNLAVPSVNGTTIPTNGGNACVDSKTGHVYSAVWEGSKSIASRSGTSIISLELPAGTYVVSTEMALAEAITGSIWFSGVAGHAQGCFGAGHANKFMTYVVELSTATTIYAYVYATAATTCTKAYLYANRIQ